MELRSVLLRGSALAALCLAPVSGWTSSHREAPFIAKNPKVDGTDFYMFNSYEPGRNGYVTLLANYIGLEDGAGGPNFFGLDPDAIYEIHIDNDGDAKEDLTFQFQFSSALANNGSGIALQVGSAAGSAQVAIPFINVGGISATDESDRNVLDTYTVTLIRGDRRTGSASPITLAGSNATIFEKPLDNIGEKTFGKQATGNGGTSQSYATYASSFIKNITIPGCNPTGVSGTTSARLFVGQRKEGFSVNLGQVFDLLDFAETNGQTEANVFGAEDQGFNTLANKNVTTLALEVPASCLTSAVGTTIGGWTTASVRQARVINPTPTFSQPSREGGAYAQVSRLGMPLVNEVVIGLPDKNKFNSSEPKDDAQFGVYVTNPTLPAVIHVLFGLTAPTVFPRADLVTAFLTGIKGVNQISATASAAEYLRLNTGILATAAASQSDFGAVGCINPPTVPGSLFTVDTSNTDCDPAGFPNGRRPGDDVVDIEIRAAMGALLSVADAPNRGCVHSTEVGCLGYVDGAGVSAADFDTTFPYLKSPIGGSP